MHTAGTMAVHGPRAARRRVTPHAISAHRRKCLIHKGSDDLPNLRAFQRKRVFSRLCARYAADINKVIHRNSGFLENLRQIKHLPDEVQEKPQLGTPRYHKSGQPGTLDKPTYAHRAGCSGAPTATAALHAEGEEGRISSLIHKGFFHHHRIQPCR
ncbi:hypothetical protein [Paracidovorax anthurii]|uniref:hypothetical protein n=1 Tax=Paracidovorax anthurii TaxID=78229 RepID=UPI0011BE63BB|nr:hypothetical protein [Paracidovorax anthurii]